MSATPPVGLPRRRVLVAALLAVPAMTGCSFGSGADEAPDPLIALADAARADVDLVRAAITADGGLAEKLQPLVDARAAHAAALDAEVVRLDPDRADAAAPTTPAPPPSLGRDPLARVREACEASGAAAAAAAVDLPAERIGLVASVAACCSTYAVVLV
ncbi:hypothetical protein [Pseudonocardia lacus]|uniref:hypothetical protein n=1 Tax=Pseudonocardia lacus TaxID=2835865 RepID=UPI001BDCCE9F|nr:hypothetical protein [Pseudonocardia lacus]